MDFFAQIDEIVGNNDLYSSSMFESSELGHIAPEEADLQTKTISEIDEERALNSDGRRFHVELMAPGYRHSDQSTNYALTNRYQKYALNVRDGSPDPSNSLSVV